MQKNLTIKELPNTERPYEKCLLYGAGSLSDAELISVIIRTGSRGERCVDLAHRILNAGPDGLLKPDSIGYRTVNRYPWNRTGESGSVEVYRRTGKADCSHTTQKADIPAVSGKYRILFYGKNAARTKRTADAGNV